ncbi:MAG: hypothetical protein IK038_03300 [Bacteroidaceae bacterium]|nr:hypothetical protein [Bacteroidaceae bacterium]
MISNVEEELRKRDQRIAELEEKLINVTEQRNRAFKQLDDLYRTKDNLYEVYTEGNSLFILTTEEHVHKFLDGKTGWYAKEISFVDAFIKYGNMTLQSRKLWEASV